MYWVHEGVEKFPKHARNASFLAHTEESGCLATGVAGTSCVKGTAKSTADTSSTSPSSKVGLKPCLVLLKSTEMHLEYQQSHFIFVLFWNKFPSLWARRSHLLSNILCLAFMLPSSCSKLSLPNRVLIREAEMKTICCLQTSSSDPLPAHILLFWFDLAAFASQKALHRILRHRLGLGRVGPWMGTELHCCQGSIWRTLVLAVRVISCLKQLCRSNNKFVATADMLMPALVWMGSGLISPLSHDTLPGLSKERLILEQQKLHKCKWNKTH